ncbi:hypothetical protein AMJ83_11320 [candidate division WOR_3 bacterium SM23_42]|uniref:Archease domain-containing protein n=1 Tax=candidate division WOR_3 bacterium SM23_42 TaxID=1703779 RepID=A0A0S8FNF4_UNCW3|nr:MAG: hypothetical protein AMJ83_11320 [candidate division WOR_3 bacterium SM23_42]
MWGENASALFVNIGKAIFETQIQGKIMADKKQSIILKGESLEDLFIDWCRELLYNFSVHGFIPVDYEVSVENSSIRAHLRGDVYDANRHRVKLEIKNPTYHNFVIEKRKKGLRARIIFDV